ncbi:MAG TPA: ATPase, T2SS/T4P/T4SS family [Tepidisphaeraceae bacterium]|nr:ATPase, T2SS/T4P/T4SS family [Tepidisphaeraceae bacterium]
MPVHLMPLAVVEGGGYLSTVKMIVAVVILLVWMRILTWVDKDAEAAYLKREPISGGFIAGAILAYALFFILPNFWICLGVLLLVFAGEIGTYLHIRKKKVGLDDVKRDLINFFKGKKKDNKPVTVEEGQVALIAKGGAVMTPPAPEDPDAAGYTGVQTVLGDALVRGAERIDMAPADGQALVKYTVDGVAYNGSTMAIDASQAAVMYIKQIAGLDLNERRKPQKGKMKVVVGKTKHELELQTAGNAAGEFLRVMVDPKKRHSFGLDDLGLTEDQLAKFRELMTEPQGIILLSAPKGQGLTSASYGILRGHDAFMTHIHTVERAPDEDIEGITQNAIPANASGEEESKQVDWIISQEPDILMLTSIESPKTAQALVSFANNGKKAYVGLRAATTFQALDMWRKLVGDDRLAVQSLKMVINGRVMRRLCNACKVGYTPDPDTVRKLNLDPARVSTLYQARTTPMKDDKGNPIPCEFCKELRYKGRFGVFEMLTVDDDVRQVVTSGGSVNQLKAIFRKQRGRFLQEMALMQVSEGETSVQEMLRVLREDSAAGAGPAAPSRGTGGEGGPGAGVAKPARPSSGGVGSSGAKPAARPSSGSGGRAAPGQAPGGAAGGSRQRPPQ